jgi:hypothetical protein
VSDVSRIKRTLHGAEIDEIISDVQARKALAIEHRRRADWRKQELAASSFRTECIHAGRRTAAIWRARSDAVISAT